jgi:hypothetical protein
MNNAGRLTADGGDDEAAEENDAGQQNPACFQANSASPASGFKER